MPPPSYEDLPPSSGRDLPPSSGRDLPPLPPELDPRGRRHARKVAADTERARRAAQAERTGGGRPPSGGGRPPSGRYGGGYPPPGPPRRPRPPHQSGQSGQGRAKLIALVLCTALSVGLLAFAGTYWWKFNQFKSNLNRVDITAAQHSSAGDPDGKDQDILVAGNDDRTDMTNAEVKALHTGRSGGSLNTDTMMIIHLPADGSRATLISLPRDSYVNIPGYGMDKLNAAYPLAYTAAKGNTAAKRSAGSSLLVRTVQSLTGLHIDHFVQVDLIGFYRISNAIGGVTVNMCAAAKEKDSGINLHKGINVIKGFQALAFVRQRHGLQNGDLDRVKRQQYFLTAAFRKVASAGILLNPFKLQDLMTAIQSSLDVDTALDPLKLGQELQNLTANKIVGKTIPSDGFADTDVGSVVVVHPDAVKSFVKNVINPPAPAKPKTNAAKPKTTTAPKATAPKATKAPAIDSKCIY